MSFNVITHPTTGVRYSIFSSPGRNLLKSYLNTYKSGGSWREKPTDEEAAKRYTKQEQQNIKNECYTDPDCSSFEKYSGSRLAKAISDAELDREEEAAAIAEEYKEKTSGEYKEKLKAMGHRHPEGLPLKKRKGFYMKLYNYDEDKWEKYDPETYEEYINGLLAGQNQTTVWKELKNGAKHDKTLNWVDKTGHRGDAKVSEFIPCDSGNDCGFGEDGEMMCDKTKYKNAPPSEDFPHPYSVGECVKVDDETD